MIPMLYQFNSAVVASNLIPLNANLNFKTQDGLRLKDCISCKVTEQERGIYDLEMVYPIDGIYYNKLSIGDVIIASHDRRKDSNQGFIIYKVSKPINGKVTIYANHISSLLSEMVVTGVQEGESMVYLWSSLHSESQGMFYFVAQQSPYDATSITMNDAVTDLSIYTIKDLLYGTEGGFLDNNYGDYIFDNNTVYHYEDGGKLINYWLQYGINITGFKEDLSIEGNEWNVLKGFWKGTDDNNNTLYVESDLIVPAPWISHDNVKRYKILDFSNSYESAPTVSALNTRVLNYGTKHIRTEAAALRDSIDISFVDLKRFSDYNGISGQLDDIHLCDRINVSFSPYNVNVQMKVSKVEWDVLKDDFIKITLGEARETISETIKQVANSK